MANNSMTIDDMLSLADSESSQQNNSMSIDDMMSFETKQETRKGVSDYFSAARIGISKGVGSAPQIAGNIIKLTADSMSGKGATPEDLFNPKAWTDRLNPFNILFVTDKLMRQQIFDKTDIDERIANFGTKMAKDNQEFIKLGFPEQEDKALKFVEDLGSGSVSLASSIMMGMIAGPIAPGVAFGVIAKSRGHQEALDAGKSYNETRVISNYLGIFEGGLEFWGVHQIIRSGGGVVKRGIKGMVTEFFQEFSQEGAEGLIKNFSDIQKQDLIQILFNALYAGSIGAILGGSSAVTVASIQKNNVKRSMVKAGIKEETARNKTNEIFNKAGESVLQEASKVINTTFEQQKKQADIIVRAAAGEELNTADSEELLRIHDEFVNEGLIDEVKEEEQQPDIQEKAEQIETVQKEAPQKEFERADEKKKIELIYKGREKQLDQRRIAIEKEMTALEGQMKERKAQKKPVTAVQNKLNTLSKELESIHFQIADLEDQAVERFEKEGILIGGKDLEQLRKKAFRQGEIALRKDLLDKIRAEKEEKALREKSKKKILKQPKRPETTIDVKFQDKINQVLNKLGKKKSDRKKSLNRMSTDELINLADEVSRLKTKGREIFQSKKAQSNMATNLLRASLIKDIGGLPEGVLSKGTTKEKRAKQTSLRRKVTLANIRPLRFIREVFGTTGEKLLYDPIDFSWTQKISNEVARKNAIADSAKKHKVSLFELGREVEIAGKGYQVNAILSMYTFQKDPHAYQMLQQGNNLSQEEIEQFIDHVRTKLPSYLAFADDVQKVVAERFKEISDVMEIYYNVKMDKVQTYFPLHVIAHNENQEGLFQDIESYFMYEQVLRKGNNFSYTSTYRPFTISRKEIDENFSSEISLNFLGDAYRALGNQEHLLAFAHLQKAYNRILNDRDIQEAVKYNYSERAWKNFNDYMLVNINPMIMMNAGGKYSKSARRIRMGLAKAALGFNVITGFKQIPSSLAVLKYSSIGQWAKSFAKILSSKEARESVYKLNPQLRNRIITRDFNELVEAIHKLPESDLKRRTLVASKSIDKAAFWMIFQWDKMAVLTAYDAVYQHQRLTKSEDEAMDLANKAVIETQPQGGIKDLPDLYRENNELLRMMLLFTNQLNQYWNMTTSDMPMEVRNKEYGKAITGLASQMLISSLIYIASHGRLPEDEDDMLEAIFGTFAGSTPLVGNLAMSLYRGYTPSISPIETLPETLGSVIGNFRNKNYIGALEKSAYLVAIWNGIPYYQFRRTVKGVNDIMNGKTTDFRRILWSEFMLENK